MKNMLFFAFVFLSVPEATLTEVPVQKFWGQNTVLLDPSDFVTLQWFIQPGNATIYWIRCYIGEATNASRHFFTYIHNTREHYTSEAFAKRHILHSLKYGFHTPVIFSLKLRNPGNVDSGMFTCELEGPGMSDPMLASLHLRVFLNREKQTESDTSYVTRFAEDGYETKNTSDIFHDYANNTVTGFYGTMQDGHRPWSWFLPIVAIVSLALLVGFLGGVTWSNKCPRALSSFRCLHRYIGDRRFSARHKEEHLTGDDQNKERCSSKNSIQESKCLIVQEQQFQEEAEETLVENRT